MDRQDVTQSKDNVMGIINARFLSNTFIDHVYMMLLKVCIQHEQRPHRTIELAFR